MTGFHFMGESYQWCLILAFVLLVGQGCLIGALVGQRRKKRQTEIELRQAKERLEEMVNLRTWELTMANQELSSTNETLTALYRQLHEAKESMIESERMAMLARMVSGVAHEINTPVGICVTLASHLQEMGEQLRGSFADMQLSRHGMEEYLNENHQANEMLLMNANRAVKLISKLKQISADQANEEWREFNVRSYIEDVLLMMHSKLKKNQHIVVLECPADLVLEGYPGALAQVLTNLIQNSLVHGYQEADSGEIRLTVQEEENHILMVYQDDGCGMSRESVCKVFDPFYTTKRNQGGTGLGMAIVYNLITQLYKGDIECESEEGKGTIFYIRLPRKVVEDKKRTDMRLIAYPYMSQLRDELKDSVQLAVFDRETILVIDFVEGIGDVRIFSRPGRRLPVTYGNFGKVFLAALPEKEARLWIEKYPLKKYAANSIVDSDQYIDRLRTVRERGISIGVDDPIDGVVSMAVPIWDGQGGMAALLAVAGAKTVSGMENMAERAERLKEVARSISTEVSQLYNE